MNAAKNKDLNNKPVSEELAEIRHLLKILTKGQQEIKSHLWRQEEQPEKPDKEKQSELIRQEAVNYINNVVMPEIEAHQAEQGEIGTQGLTDWFIEN